MGQRVIRVVAAVIEQDGSYLITQRKSTALLPLLWEFPGGRVEHGETDEQALAREVKERLGVDVATAAPFAEHTHQYDGYDLHLATFAVTLIEGSEPRPLAVNDLRWVTTEQMARYKFPPADQKTMDKLLGINASA